MDSRAYSSRPCVPFAICLIVAILAARPGPAGDARDAWQQPERVVTDLAIKPGGFLFLIDYRKSREVTFDPYEKLIPRDDLVKLGSDAGLSLDAELHYLKYQVGLRFRKPPNE